jgi:hypothetical protein
MALDAKQLAAKFNAAAKAMDVKPLVAVGAQAAKTVLADRIAKDSGGDSRLSGVKSGKVGVNYKIHGDVAEVKAFGPMQFLEGDTARHRIGPKKKGKRRGVAIPGIGVRAYAWHPGTKGKQTWTRGVDAAVPKAAEAMVQATVKSVTGAF